MDLSHNLKDFDDTCFLPIPETLQRLHIILQLTQYTLQKIVNMMHAQASICEGVFCEYIKVTVKSVPSPLYEGQCCKLIGKKAMEYIFLTIANVDLTIAIVSTATSTFTIICFKSLSFCHFLTLMFLNLY